MEAKWYDWVASILLIIGGINWGLGIWDVNLVTAIFGNLSNAIYGLVGISGVYGLYMWVKLALD